MINPKNPIAVPSGRAVKALPDGRKSKVIIQISCDETNQVRAAFGSAKPTANVGILLSPGDKLLLEDSGNDLVGILWLIGIGGSVNVEVSVL